MNLGPKRVAYIKPTRTGEEILAIIFHWVFEQCLTFASILLLSFNSLLAFVYVVFRFHLLRYLTTQYLKDHTGKMRCVWKTYHSPNLFFSSLRISSPNSVWENWAMRQFYQHIIIIVINLFIHEIISLLHGLSRNRVWKFNIIIMVH